MKVASTILFLMLVGFSLPVGSVSAERANRIETKHLIIEWGEGTVASEIEAAKTEGERFYTAIAEKLGQKPKGKITILLRGPAEHSDGSRGYPHVDSRGRIHLFRFGPTFRSYFSALAHEMVHAFRLHRRPHADWFFEEGFAEFVALRVDLSLRGFPWYDSPVVVAAGQWVAKGEDISLKVLRDRHQSLNQPCKAQSYTLRSSFFHYLGDTYGDDALLRMANRERAGDTADYPRFFHKDFGALEAEWRTSLLAEYRSMDDVDELSRRYRQETPIQYMGVCKKGVQY